MAEPGSICISEISHKNLHKQTRSEFTDAGERELKNIPGPVRVYNWIGKQSRAPQHKQLFELLDKPSIAVLPFDNMSGDPDQEYFADGIAEDIITALSCSPWLFVIALNSSFSFRGQSVEPRSIAEKLGVCYLLEGSVRKAGDRVRIKAKLIDGISGSHVWAEKYDGSLDGIFELQDEITRNVVFTSHLNKAQRSSALRPTCIGVIGRLVAAVMSASGCLRTFAAHGASDRLGPREDGPRL